MPKFGAIIVGIAVAAALAAGCSRRSATVTPPASSPVIVIFDVVGAKPLRATTFDVTALDRPGKPHAPFTAAQVSLTMPDMSMPPNVISLKTVSPSHFTGRGTFTMAGRWNAAVHLTMQDGKTVDQDFPVIL